MKVRVIIAASQAGATTFDTRARVIGVVDAACGKTGAPFGLGCELTFGKADGK
jgi:hypothetical protein